MLWAIWWERNKRIFRKDFSLVQRVCDKLEYIILESVNVHAMCVRLLSYLFTSADNVILKNWKLVKIPFKGALVGKISKYEMRWCVSWEEPTIPFVKLKFDSASKGNLGRSGSGVVLCNPFSHILKAMFS